MKKALSVVLSVALMATSIVVMPKETKAASTGKVTLTVEKLSIGQGLYTEPVQVTINNGDTVKTVIDRYMNDNTLNYYYSTTSGWYLTSILGADNSRVANIPNEIVNMQDVYTYSYIGQDDGLLHEGKGISAPNTNKNLGNSDTALGEGDYWKMSGWVFTVNNSAVYSGKTFNREDGKDSTNPTVRNIYQSGDKVTVKNGDVIRVMFTLFGYGADVGIDTYQATGVSKINLADKTELLRAVGDVNSNKGYWTVYPNVNAAYSQAATVASQYNPSQATVNSAATALKNAIKSPQNPPVGTVKIKTAKNAKGKKIKLTLTKTAGVTGFRIKYGNNKKLKNKKKKKQQAVTVKTTKTTYTTKKITNIKKKKAYVKIRAYRIVNGKYVYGKWSAVKTVKVKK